MKDVMLIVTACISTLCVDRFVMPAQSRSDFARKAVLLKSEEGSCLVSRNRIRIIEYAHKRTKQHEVLVTPTRIEFFERDLVKGKWILSETSAIQAGAIEVFSKQGHAGPTSVMQDCDGIVIKVGGKELVLSWRDVVKAVERK